MQLIKGSDRSRVGTLEIHEQQGVWQDSVMIRRGILKRCSCPRVWADSMMIKGGD